MNIRHVLLPTLFLSSLSAFAQTTTTARPSMMVTQMRGQLGYPAGRPLSARVGGGYVMADRGAGHQFLIRASIVGGAREVIETGGGVNCVTLIAQTDVDATASVDDLNALNIRFIPVRSNCERERRDTHGPGSAHMDFAVLPTAVSRDLRITREYSVRVDIAGVELGMETMPVSNLRVYARGFATLLGFQAMTQGVFRDRPGFHAGRVEATVGMDWIPNHMFTLGVRLGGSADFTVLGPDDGRSFDGASEQDLFVRLEAIIARHFTLFAEGTYFNRWDSANDSAGIAQFIAGVEFTTN